MSATATELLTGDETADGIESAAPTGRGQRRRWFKRANRKGLGTTELAIVALVIIIVGILAGIGITRARSARDSAEYGVLTANIDQIAQIADTYWGQHAADIDGRRKISLLGFCQYANSQLAAEEINLRTMQLATTSGKELTDPAIANDAMVPAIKRRTTPTIDSTRAGCPFNTGDPADLYADIVAVEGTPIAAVPSIATDLGDVDDDSVPAGFQAAVYNTGSIAVSVNADTHASELEAAGLLSTRTVWMMQLGDGGALDTGNSNTDYVPDGTDTDFATTGTFRFPQATHGVEVLVFGGMAPDGTSFCLIKVFDASDNDRIGEYRVARNATDDRQFAVCTDGVNADNENTPERGGSWPEPR